MAVNSALKIQSIKWHKIDVDKPETWPDEGKSILLYKMGTFRFFIVIHRENNYWFCEGDYEDTKLEMTTSDIWAEIPMPPDCLIKGK